MRTCSLLTDPSLIPNESHQTVTVVQQCRIFCFMGVFFFSWSLKMITAIQIWIGLCPSLGCWPDSSCESVFCSSSHSHGLLWKHKLSVIFVWEMTQSWISVLAESLHSTQSSTECHTPKYVSWPAPGYFLHSNLHRQALLHKKVPQKTSGTIIFVMADMTYRRWHWVF